VCITLMLICVCVRLVISGPMTGRCDGYAVLPGYDTIYMDFTPEDVQTLITLLSAD